MKSTQNFSGRVTIRLPPEKLEIYREFKFIVTEIQHSDICYVIGELIEAYVNAVKQIPNPDSKTLLTFVKQNIQINMGCNFNYNVKKPKRLPHQNLIDTQDLEAQVKLQKNYLLPNLIEQWPTLKPQAQLFWRKALTTAGILPLGSNPGCTDQYTQSCVNCHTQLRRLNDFMWRQANGFQWK